jgi:diguanylate cyclase (GGDEF)-like protein
LALAERLRVSIAGIRIDDGQTPLTITASFGVVQRAESCLNVDELTSRADKCLYQAKTDGRNRVCDRFAATADEA